MYCKLWMQKVDFFFKSGRLQLLIIDMLLILGSFLISTILHHPVGLEILAHLNGGIGGLKIYITCILGSFYS